MKREINNITWNMKRVTYLVIRNKLIVLVLSLAICVSSFMLYVPSVSALNMNSPRFRIQWGNIDIGGRTQDSDSYNLTTSLGQTAAHEFASSGYVVKAGFQYIYSIIPFTFSISNTSINFGTLLASTPVTASTTLTVSFGGAGQYVVTAAERGTLRTLSSNTIPDTTCNGGGNTCDESNAKLWTSASAYGFGYTMSGDDVPTDFINTTYYRPFPDTNLAENPATVMSSTNVSRSRQATMTMKVNISSVQPAGTYRTVVSFVATPSY